MESIISTFHIDWKIIIAQAINFGIVFIVLYVYALKPLGKFMKERGEKIEKGIEDAKRNDALVKAAQVEYDAAIKKAEQKAHELFQKGKKEAEEKKAAMLEEASREAAMIIENGKKTSETQKAKMVEEAKGEIASLAMLATEKLISNKHDLQNL